MQSGTAGAESRVAPETLAAMEVDPEMRLFVPMIPNPPREARVLEVLGERIGRRPRWVRERFRQVTGLEIVAVIHAAKTRRAALRLRDTTDKVDAIAKSEGYADGASFGHSFQRDTGIGPDEYRAWARVKKRGDLLAGRDPAE